MLYTRPILLYWMASRSERVRSGPRYSGWWLHLSRAYCGPTLILSLDPRQYERSNMLQARHGTEPAVPPRRSAGMASACALARAHGQREMTAMAA